MAGVHHSFTSGKAAAADTTVVDGPDWDTPHYYVGDSVNVGAVIYAGASGKLTNLNSVAVGRVLISSGVGVAPAWSTSPLLTHIQFSQTDGDEITPLTIQSTDATKGPWNLIVADADFLGTEDSVLYLGYNVTAGGGNSVNVEPSFRFCIEQDFDDGLADHKLEAYFEWRDGSGVSPRKQLRPLFWQFSRDTGNMMAFEILTTNGISFKHWSDSSPQWAILGPESFEFLGTSTQSSNTQLVLGAQNGKFAELTMQGGFQILPEALNQWKLINNSITALQLYSGGQVSISASTGVVGGILSVGVPTARKDDTYSIYVQRIASQTTSLIRVATEAGAGSPLFVVEADGKTLVNGPGLGTSSTSGLAVQNTTAAAAGSQQISPGLDLVGQGWKTNATAASQEVRWRQEVLPVQGSANPTSIWKLKSSVDGGAFTEVLTVSATALTSAVPFLGPGGSAGAVTYGWTTDSDSDTGMYHIATNGIGFATNATARAAIVSNHVQLASDVDFGWTSTTDPNGTVDVLLSRAAANRLRLATGDVFNLQPTAFASLPTGSEGDLAWVNNSTTATWGATIAGGGANKVLAVFNGTNWTVAAV